MWRARKNKFRKSSEAENSLLFKSSKIEQFFHFSLLFSTADASDELKSKTFTNPVKVDDDIL